MIIFICGFWKLNWCLLLKGKILFSFFLVFLKIIYREFVFDEDMRNYVKMEIRDYNSIYLVGKLLLDFRILFLILKYFKND